MNEALLNSETQMELHVKNGNQSSIKQLDERYSYNQPTVCQAESIESQFVTNDNWFT